jgi:hypothetical protein
VHLRGGGVGDVYSGIDYVSYNMDIKHLRMIYTYYTLPYIDCTWSGLSVDNAGFPDIGPRYVYVLRPEALYTIYA